LKSRPKASTFRARLWRSFALLALVVLAMLWLLQTVFMQAFYDQAVKEGVRDAAAQARQAWVSKAPATFESTLDAIASDKSLLVIVATWDEEVLYGTDELRAEFMANVSHDLRTPLTLIRGYAEAALDDLGDGRAVDGRDLGVIAREAERLGSLAGELLDYSKLRDGGISMCMAAFDASESFAKAVELFSPLCGRSGITLQVDIESGLRAVGDEAQLVRVVSNLLDNAVSHTPAGSAVTASLREEVGSLRFEVRDGGPGIPLGEVDRVWERYFTKKQAGRNAKGSGLGLAISREILDAHGAAYGAENLPEGGSVFWFAISSANTEGNVTAI